MYDASALNANAQSNEEGKRGRPVFYQKARLGKMWAETLIQMGHMVRS